MMEMDIIFQKNLLIKEGRRLATGEGSKKLSPEDWFFLYEELEDELTEVQVQFCDEFEIKIRRKYCMLQ